MENWGTEHEKKFQTLNSYSFLTIFLNLRTLVLHSLKWSEYYFLHKIALQIE